MFWSKNKKKQVYPCIPQFCYIKVGFKGVYITRTYCPDDVIYVTLKFLINSSISGLMLMVSKYLLYLLYGCPSGVIRNFSKFQEMSVLETGSQIMLFGSFINDRSSSEGNGNWSRR